MKGKKMNPAKPSKAEGAKPSYAFNSTEAERAAFRAQTAQHTPGPWHTKETITGIEIHTTTEEFLPLCKLNGGWRDAEANARLIAAAPELLAECEKAADRFDFTVAALAKGQTVSISSLQNCAAELRSVVARAKGGQ